MSLISRRSNNIGFQLTGNERASLKAGVQLEAMTRANSRRYRDYLGWRSPKKAVRIALQIAPPLTQAENIEQIRRSLRSLFR
jgi:hypothetical protein